MKKWSRSMRRRHSLLMSLSSRISRWDTGNYKQYSSQLTPHTSTQPQPFWTGVLGNRGACGNLIRNEARQARRKRTNGYNPGDIKPGSRTQIPTGMWIFLFWGSDCWVFTALATPMFQLLWSSQTNGKTRDRTDRQAGRSEYRRASKQTVGQADRQQTSRQAGTFSQQSRDPQTIQDNFPPHKKHLSQSLLS